MQFYPKELVSKTFSKRHVLKYLGAATLVGGIRVLLEQKAQSASIPQSNVREASKNLNVILPPANTVAIIQPPLQSHSDYWKDNPISAVEDALGRLWFFTKVNENGRLVNRVFYRQSGQTIKVDLDLPEGHGTLLVRKRVGSQQQKLVLIVYQQFEFFTELYQIDIPGFAF
jgi:hypothetical protein